MKRIVLLGVMTLMNSFLVSAGTAELITLDKSTGEPVPVRVLIITEKGDYCYPSGAVTLQIGKEIWFISEGRSILEIPSGTAEIRIERGKEYIRLKEKIVIPDEGEFQLKFTIERWINMKERGYLSGENHIHLPAEETAAMCAGEDLNFGTSLQWWNRPRFGVPESEGNIAEIEFGGRTIPVSLYDAEVEEAWGALYIINLPHPFPFLNNPEMPNLLAAEYGHEYKSLNCYQAGWSREVLIDALLGLVDVVNICNNNFHMHRYQPRSHYSNLLNIEDFPLYDNTPEDMKRMNTETYYRLLNCGLKISAGAGSATGAKETPVGYNRTYVRSSQEDGLNGFISSWKEGKNFVTNGPMLFLRTAQGLRPGDVFNLSESKNIVLRIEAFSDSPLNEIEIVVNGNIMKKIRPGENTFHYTDSLTIEVNKSSWIAACCTDYDMLLSDEELATYKSPRVNLYQDPSRLRFAHTSPIYIHLDGKNVAVRESILEGLKIVDAFKEFARKKTSSEYMEKIMNAAEMAKHILLNKLK